MNESNKKISVKMRVVAFSDLPTVKEVSFRQVGVGQMKLSSIRSLDNQEAKDKIVPDKIEENVIVNENKYTQEDLEREGNESLF